LNQNENAGKEILVEKSLTAPSRMGKKKLLPEAEHP